jgi:dynactin-6
MASSSSSSKRHTVLAPVSQAGPKAPVQFSSSITIADSAILSGSHLVAIGAESVIHPRAKLESLIGPVTIARRCVVHERGVIGATPSSSTAANGIGKGVALEDYVTVEVGAVVEAGGTVVGEGSMIGVGARVGCGASIGKVR